MVEHRYLKLLLLSTPPGTQDAAGVGSIDSLEYDGYKFLYLSQIDHADDDLIGDAEVTTTGYHFCDEPVRSFHLQEDGQISAYAA